MKKVVVILPTYNGEKYLREQLDSLFNQTYENIVIYTRDDGSKDNTVDIINEYAKKKIKGKKMVVIPNGGKTLKCPDCFIKLLEQVKEGDYFFFCDQDDVWLKDKIKDAVNHMEKVDSKTPVLHFGAYDMVDKDLNLKSHFNKLPKKVRLRNVIYDYWPLGFNIGFNKALYDFVFNNSPKRIYYHDCFFAQVAIGCGEFIFDNKTSVLYRRQEDAVTYSNHSKIELFKWRLKRFFGGNKNNLVQLRDILKEYKELYCENLSKKDNKMLNTFTKKSILNYFKKVFYPHRLRLRIVDELGLRFLFLINKL